MKTPINRLPKIVLVMVISYLISNFSIKNVFIAESPKLNPFFVTNTIARVNNFWSKTGNFIASINLFPKFNLFNKTNQTAYNSTNNNQNMNNTAYQPNSLTLSKAQINSMIETPLKKISKGIYAGENDGYKVYKINTDELGYITYTFTIEGKEVKFKVPSDQQAPSQEEVEKLF
jgi:hypothetical protein